MKKIGIVVLLLLLIGCDNSSIQTSDTTTNSTSDVLTSIGPQTTQVQTTFSIIKPEDYIDGVHISSYWYSAMDEDDKWGFIDSDGDVVVPFICDEYTAFENGTAIVTIHDLKGVINFLGSYVLIPTYDYIESLNHNMFFSAKNDDEDPTVFDNVGHELFSIEGIDHYSSVNSENLLRYEIGSLSGLINVDGEYVTECIFETINPFYEGVSAVQKNGLWGFIDEDGEYTVDPIYNNATNFSNGIASVLLESGLWRAINEFGFAFDQTSQIPFDFNEFGISLFQEDDHVGLIYKSGVISIQPVYEPINNENDLNFEIGDIYKNSVYQVIFDSTGTIRFRTSIYNIMSYIDNYIVVQDKETELYSVIDFYGRL